jgi:hypothetical protein
MLSCACAQQRVERWRQQASVPAQLALQALRPRSSHAHLPASCAVRNPRHRRLSLARVQAWRSRTQSLRRGTRCRVMRSCGCCASLTATCLRCALRPASRARGVTLPRSRASGRGHRVSGGGRAAERLTEERLEALVARARGGLERLDLRGARFIEDDGREAALQASPTRWTRSSSSSQTRKANRTDALRWVSHARWRRAAAACACWTSKAWTVRRNLTTCGLRPRKS